MKKNYALLILPLVLISMVLGIWTGLARIGWYQIALPEITGEHGAVIVGSFLGTLIILERTVTQKKKWLYLLPALSGISIFFFLAGFSVVAYILLSLASLGLVALFVYFYQKQKENYLLVMLVGAGSWFAGNLIMLIHDLYPLAAYWWVAFFLLTITGERIELTRYLPRKELKSLLFAAANGIFVLGILLPYHSWGRYLVALGLIATGVGLLLFDIATKSWKREGLSRYLAAGLLTGYVWLVISGVFFAIGFDHAYGYDAAMHAFFIGFVFSMIFAHGPIILPGVVGLPFKPYHPVLYVWLGLLHLSLLVRIIADYLIWIEIRLAAGITNGFSILAFFITMLILVKKEKVALEKFKSLKIGLMKVFL